MANTTDKSILTAAGKALLAQLNAEEKPLIIDKMIFANVPNRPEYPQPDDVVPTDHIVHQEQVEQRGRLSADSVIYSTTLTSGVGPFEFNWTGAYCSEYGVLVTIDHHALTPKTADQPGVAGNTLVRSVVLEYKDIAEITNITVDASSWQYNATPRMKKMDDDVAQAIIDQNGKDWFIDDGFLVTPQASAFNIKAGAGYVSGNRVAMEFDRSVQVPNKPSFIYIDAHREGTPTGEQVTLFNFVVTAEEKDDYIDSSTGKDVKHFVCKIAQVLADGSVSDLRPEGESASRGHVAEKDKEFSEAEIGKKQLIGTQVGLLGQKIKDESVLYLTDINSKYEFLQSVNEGDAVESINIDLLQAVIGGVTKDLQKNRVCNHTIFSSKITHETMKNRTKTQKLQRAIEYLQSKGGGELIIDTDVTLEPENINSGCLWVYEDNITISCLGEGALRTKDNKHVPIHVSKEKDLLTVNIVGEVENFRAHTNRIFGTGEYEYAALCYGRGILLRKVKSASIHGNDIHGMSMIGIDTNAGSGYFLTFGNQVHDCFYSAIVYNGRAYQSIIAANICSGSIAPNSVAIQVTGHCMVVTNTVFGRISGTESCGGIMWGEGPYTGLGIIAHNIVKHCAWGVKSIFHGPCLINGNLCINIKGQAGIITTKLTSDGMPVSSSDNSILNNILINCRPFSIDSGCDDDDISGNKCLYIGQIVNPSAATEPDTIENIRPELHILCRGNNSSLVNNTCKGGKRGIGKTIGSSIARMGLNSVTGSENGSFVWQSKNSPGVFVATEYIPTVENNGGSSSSWRVRGANKPQRSFLPIGSIWDKFPLVVGQPMGGVVIVTRDTALSSDASAGDVNVVVDNSASILASSGNVLCIELEDNRFDFTEVTSVNGNVIGFQTPLTRNAKAGGQVYYQQWRDFPML